jgi:hypothetical protein
MLQILEFPVLTSHAAYIIRKIPARFPPEMDLNLLQGGEKTINAVRC